MKNRKLFGLQLFAEAVAGKKIVYLYRILSTEKDMMQRHLHLQPRMSVPSQKMLIQQQQKMERCVLQGQQRWKSQLPVF